MPYDHRNFSWDQVSGLFGVPYRDPRVQQLFTRVGLDPDALLGEVRVGIYSMPPHDKQPSPTTEIDLSPSFRVRMRFKHARLILGAQQGVAPDESVVAAITYLLESKVPGERFEGALPYGIAATDDPAAIERRAGAAPTEREWDPQSDSGYSAWKERNPILHVLLSVPERRPLRVNVFLAPNPASPV